MSLCLPASLTLQVLFESWTLTRVVLSDRAELTAAASSTSSVRSSTCALLLTACAVTVLPPLVIGIFDQFVNARMLDRYPEIYAFGMRNAFVRAAVFRSDPCGLRVMPAYR